MAQITPLIAGNWKMNGTTVQLGEVERLAELVTEGDGPRCTVVICPPATMLERLNTITASAGIVTGGQDCHPAAHGPHTGDISAQMLSDCGAQYVIVGHSERRLGHGETDHLVQQKALAAFASGLVPIICVGESEDERESGSAEKVVLGQLAEALPDNWGPFGFIVAYEPVWAIGTGKTPTMHDIEDMHATIRKYLVEHYGENGEGTRILYGGSMKPYNARDILRLKNVNGGLVGGASLLANDFYNIISAV
ncbi:triose-phosphate isomerase [Devosia sp.]|uniref:triose-phosphate isomerase n=1 Tax=Devosia sp. TaxID=1871048 RepID=UPI003A907BAA